MNQDGDNSIVCDFIDLSLIVDDFNSLPPSSSVNLMMKSGNMCKIRRTSDHEFWELKGTNVSFESKGSRT